MGAGCRAACPENLCHTLPDVLQRWGSWIMDSLGDPCGSDMESGLHVPSTYLEHLAITVFQVFHQRRSLAFLSIFIGQERMSKQQQQQVEQKEQEAGERLA